MSVDLDELDRLRAAATTGEWKVLTIASPDGISERIYAEDGASAIDLAHIPMTWPKHGRLIVALVNAYPSIAAELRELRAKVEKLEEVRRLASDYILSHALMRVRFQDATQAEVYTLSASALAAALVVLDENDTK